LFLWTALVYLFFSAFVVTLYIHCSELWFRKLNYFQLKRDFVFVVGEPEELLVVGIDRYAGRGIQFLGDQGFYGYECRLKFLDNIVK
jgi:hypothetical protein